MVRQRLFHIGDLFARIVDNYLLPPRGAVGAVALVQHMAGRTCTLCEIIEHLPSLREAIITAYPASGTFGPADSPPQEFIPEFLARRATEFGTYLPAPVLPPDHPLRSPDPVTTGLDEDDRAVLAHLQRLQLARLVA